MNRKIINFIIKKYRFLLIYLIIILVATLYASIYLNSRGITEQEIIWLQEQDSIIYAANENAPPLRFLDSVDNQYKGVVIDYINQLSLELGVDIRTVPMKWEEALESLKSGDTHICDMFINEERSKHYLFTNPIYNLRTVLLSHSNNNFELSQINNMKIATETGDYANRYLIDNYPKAKLIYVNNVEEAYEMFINGQADAVIGDEPIITYLLDKDKESKLSINTHILYEEEVVLAVSKNKPELVSILNKGIARINKKGVLEEIQQKWFGISTPLIKNSSYYDIIRNIVIFIVIAGTIFTVIIFNNLSLKKQVKKRTKELENSRNELQIIFDGITEFMLVVDNKKNIINVNKSFADYFGISNAAELEGERCEKFIRSFCGDCSSCLIEEAFKIERNIKREIISGNEVYEMNVQFLKDTNNSLLITIKNITLDKINRNKVLQTNKMIAVGQLAAGMAHEIRNPLGIIRTQSYLIRNDSADESINKSLDYIDSAVNRSSKIIENILSFSRFSGKEKQLINFNQTIQSIVEMYNDIIKKQNITVNISCSIKEELLLNSESIEHVILNLISNSIDAMDVGGILNIRAYIKDGSVVIECEDNGCGIDEKDMNNIFNPFFTTKELDKGTGLGLFIVFSEVQKLGGKVDVKSEIGEGTVFTVAIPLEGIKEK